MKRIVSFFLAVVCLLSLAACGSKKPSLEEVEQALQEGTLTLEDAVGKGYVTQDWADEYWDGGLLIQLSRATMIRIRPPCWGRES